MKSKPFVSVIIPVYNDAHRLQQCLQALYVQTYPSSRYEVVVVDNGSTEDIATVARSFPNVVMTQEAKRGSFQARNQGLTVARGDIVAFTDTDCVPSAEWLTAGVQLLSDTAIAAGRIAFTFKGSKPSAAELLDSQFYLQQETYVRQEQYGATANLFVWREVFTTIGGFNTQLPNLGDKEWCQRAYQAGFSIRYCATAIVEHPARQLSALLAKARRQTRANYILYSLRYGKPTPKKMVQSVLNQCHPATFWNALKDGSLSRRERLRYLWVVLCFRWAIACQLISLLLRPTAADGAARAIIRAA